MPMQRSNNKSSKTVYVTFYIKKCVGIQCLSPLFVFFPYSSYDSLRTRVYTTVVLPIWITASDSSLAESNCQLA